MSETPPDSLIPYDEIVQAALRSVIQRVLARVADEGLPGDHHFYISFKTKAAGVMLPPRLLARHPDEMTIVLQHRFDNLVVNETDFQVTLSFDQVPSALTIPYSAIIAFADPAVEFGLQFAVSEDEVEEGDSAQAKALPAVEREKGSNIVKVDFAARNKR